MNDDLAAVNQIAEKFGSSHIMCFVLRNETGSKAILTAEPESDHSELAESTDMSKSTSKSRRYTTSRAANMAPKNSAPYTTGYARRY